MAGDIILSWKSCVNIISRKLPMTLWKNRKYVMLRSMNISRGNILSERIFELIFTWIAFVIVQKRNTKSSSRERERERIRYLPNTMNTQVEILTLIQKFEGVRAVDRHFRGIRAYWLQHFVYYVQNLKHIKIARLYSA